VELAVCMLVKGWGRLSEEMACIDPSVICSRVIYMYEYDLLFVSSWIDLSPCRAYDAT